MILLLPLIIEKNNIVYFQNNYFINIIFQYDDTYNYMFKLYLEQKDLKRSHCANCTNILVDFKKNLIFIKHFFDNSNMIIKLTKITIQIFD